MLYLTLNNKIRLVNFQHSTSPLNQRTELNEVAGIPHPVSMARNKIYFFLRPRKSKRNANIYTSTLKYRVYI